MSHFQQHVNTTFSRYYIGGGQYERDWHNGKWRNSCYVQSPTGLIALHLEDEDTQEQQLVYTYTDYQGSILALADADGTILEAFSYDPWGNRRTPDTWTNIYTNAETHYTYADPNALWGNFYRGYTGHEHLDVFGIINMNGRLYDPLVARMLSPDNFVQNPSYSQNFNRYSYVYNNPLHSHWDKPGVTRYVIAGSDGNYVDPEQVAHNTPVGQTVELDKFIVSRYHGDWDYNTGGRPSFVINRYDGSYYSRSGTSYSVVNPPINRFVYSFFFWR